MYNVESKDGYNVYTFQGVNLKIKSVVHEDNTFVYINYNGYNPLLSMLLKRNVKMIRLILQYKGQFAGLIIPCMLLSITMI